MYIQNIRSLSEIVFRSRLYLAFYNRKKIQYRYTPITRDKYLYSRDKRQEYRQNLEHKKRKPVLI